MLAGFEAQLCSLLQLPANMYPREQQVIAQESESCNPHRRPGPHMDSLAPDIGLARFYLFSICAAKVSTALSVQGILLSEPADKYKPKQKEADLGIPGPCCRQISFRHYPLLPCAAQLQHCSQAPWPGRHRSHTDSGQSYLQHRGRPARTMPGCREALIFYRQFDQTPKSPVLKLGHFVEGWLPYLAVPSHTRASWGGGRGGVPAPPSVPPP